MVNKINKNMNVTFLHNVFDRHETLLETINKERELYPKSKVHIAYNYKELDMSKLSTFDEIKFYYFSQSTHKIGCTNGFLLSIKESLIDNSKVYFFSHDDVSISNPNIFKDNIDLISSGKYDIICRKPINIYGDKYFMMEGVFMSRKVVEKFSKINLLENETKIPKDIKGSHSPEVYLAELILNSNFKYKVFEFDHESKEYNNTLSKTLGLHHKNIGKRGWKD